MRGAALYTLRYTASNLSSSAVASCNHFTDKHGRVVIRQVSSTICVACGLSVYGEGLRCYWLAIDLDLYVSGPKGGPAAWS